MSAATRSGSPPTAARTAGPAPPPPRSPPGVCRRAAANSIASGKPSRRLTISTISARCVASGSKAGDTAVARCRNSSTAGACSSSAGQRRHGAQLLACHTQPLPARRHDRHVGAATDDPCHELCRPSRARARSCPTSTINSSSPSTSTIRSTGRCAGTDVDPQRRGHRRRAPTAASAWASSHSTTCRSGRRRLQPVTELDQQAGLAHTARADERHQPQRLDPLRQLRRQRVAADEWGCRDR